MLVTNVNDDDDDDAAGEVSQTTSTHGVLSVVVLDTVVW